MSYLGVPYITALCDYIIYKDAFDASKIKAYNTKTAQVQFNHATDFGNVYNSCVSALPSTGGIIQIGSGTFETATTCTFKDYLTVKGAGVNVTIIKLANTQNKDVMATPSLDTMFSNRPANGYFTETNVIHDVTLQDFSIDGNKANNATGRYGLAKIAYAWNITNLCIYNCKNDGFYSEWGSVVGCPGNPDPTRRCMEDYWWNVYCHHNDGVGLRFRGPHDSNIVCLMAWGNNTTQVEFEATGTAYSGGCQVSHYHCFASIATPATMTRITASVIMANGSIEGGLGTGGIGLLVTGTGKLDLTGSVVFANDTGIKIDTANTKNKIDAEFHSNNYGIEILGTQNKISGYFRDNTVADIKIGSATTTAGYNDIRAKCTRTPTALVWGHTGNTQNYIELSVVILAGHAVLSGTPNLTTNHVSIWGIDSSNDRIPALAQPFVPMPNSLPSYKKTGTLQCVATSSGDGLWGFSYATQGSAVGTGVAADGRFVRWTTGAVAGDNAGILINTPVTMRGWNARMRVKFRIQNIDCRVFIGFRGNSAAHPSGDDPFNADPNFCLGKRAADTVWQIARNDATDVTVFSNLAGNPTIDTNIHTVDFWTDANGYGLRLDGGADNYFSTEVPTASHFMAQVFEIETSVAFTRYLDLFYAEIVQDK